MEEAPSQRYASTDGGEVNNLGEFKFKYLQPTFTYTGLGNDNAAWLRGSLRDDEGFFKRNLPRLHLPAMYSTFQEETEKEGSSFKWKIHVARWRQA